ncbi:MULTISPECIES: small hydrophobic protein [Streptomyces]|uniref:Small hydrophobic protein n=1 Tax=Streptomyces lycii TaxID=2654337 RepID=A0ABQ7FEA2_9ACTN|nr:MULTISPECIES: small hydrophobic protein [Streptomyces]KAF4405547.1 small hydrophobic protein [Streptomyces lycii]PGH50577.1 small hydrophobic protein [Streptomyces sp. Ru87]
MTGLGNPRTRRNLRSRGRMGSGSGPDRATLGIIGLVCAVAGFFVLGIVLGPVAIVCGWLSMGRRWNSGSRHIPALVAVVLGAVDTVLSILWLAGATGSTAGLI